MATTDPTDQVATLCEQLTREEKLRLVQGAPDPEGTATGYVPGIERLEIPPFRLVDGPMGVRAGGFEEGLSATAFPASIALAATFDPDLARRQGAAMGREAKARGQDAVLGPGVNLIRVPHCGRNFEYFSEDPALASALGAGVVEGLQDEDVVATPKHYVANSQETDRVTVSAEVDERTLRELYLPAFRAAVEAGAGSVMTAYNRINGTYANDHRYLVQEVLKDEWGFDGYVVSDWFATKDTVGAATGGLDLEMPGGSVADAFSFDAPDDDGEEDGDHSADASAGPPEDVDLESIFTGGMPGPEQGGVFGDSLAEAIESGDVSPERLDDMVVRILGQLERIGLLEGEGATTERDDREGELDTPEHRDLAEQVATRGTVLLKNDGVLPLSDDDRVALIGPNVDEATVGGGGSSAVTPFREVSPVEGLRDRAGEISVARGVPEIESMSFEDLFPFGDDADGDQDDGPEPTVEEAVSTAAEADVAVVFVRDATTEARDRESLRLPGEQEALVDAVADAADRTVVVVNSSGPVELPWREDVDAIVEAWYPGQADGDATAAVLYGDVDPAGRLPVTFAPEDEYPITDERRYPGVDDEAHYEEGLFVGYRHFDDAGVEPTYPFGHGDSYAEFEYGDVEVEDGDDTETTIRVPLENVADRSGREVVQVYVRPPKLKDGPERPVRELAGFAAVDLEAGETRTVEITLADRALARYDEDDGWTVDPGEYVLEVGRSSRDVRSTTALER
ncbi:beta-glucosidase [Natronoglomus mannanivorans]|uniref:Glycoside hydrolase family 3 C-terminal domain-containing protein n=1 Tax=Natronoglomus mannanivorans TaxID=2979990 RepID=A0AAP3E4A1_9EURY|nr:glycoside hydrolase family 3 C-terminal domain-containing protein [Halobacteria archaeon AArc-xg1-1]